MRARTVGLIGFYGNPENAADQRADARVRNSGAGYLLGAFLGHTQGAKQPRTGDEYWLLGWRQGYRDARCKKS